MRWLVAVANPEARETSRRLSSTSGCANSRSTPIARSMAWVPVRLGAAAAEEEELDDMVLFCRRNSYMVRANHLVQSDLAVRRRQ